MHFCFFSPTSTWFYLLLLLHQPPSASTALSIYFTRYSFSFSETRKSIYKLCNHLVEVASKQQSGAVGFYRYVALINHCSSVRLRYHPLHQSFAGTSDTLPAHLLKLTALLPVPDDQLPVRLPCLELLPSSGPT